MNTRRKLLFFGKRGGAPALWTPAEINSELTSWLDTAGATHLVLDDGRITQFSDQSGNSNHATQGSAAMQATYDATSQAAQFDGGAKYDAPSFLSGNDATVMHATSYQLTGDLYQYAFFAGTNPRFYPFRLGNPDFAWGYDDDAGFLTKPADTNTHIGGLRNDGTQADAYFDGAMIGSYVRAASGFPAIVVGGLPSSPRLEGRIREIVCATSLSDTDIEKLEGYLAWKWDGIEASNNLVAKLPANHPYKNNPPTV